VNLDQSQTSLVHVDFVPTPEKRAAYVSSANFHRTWGIIGLIAGGAIGIGSGVFLATKSTDDIDQAQAALSQANLEAEQKLPPHCATAGIMNTPEECQAYLDEKVRAVNNAKSADKTKTVIGWVGVGVGSALAVTGLVLLLTGDDPGRYDKPPSNKLGRRPTPGPKFAFGPGPGEIGGSLGVVF
jgi:hypothetical protein